MNRFYQLPINAYQSVSKLFPANCRYYPSCSEYAKWQFELNRADKALLQTTLRILRCNQLFEGGIDYPIIKYTPPKLLCLSQNIKSIKYWLIPKDKKLFYVIKDYGAYQ